MTMNYYHHNSRIYLVDREEPKIEDYILVGAKNDKTYQRDMDDFRHYLATCVSYECRVEGLKESTATEGKDFVWRYEVFTHGLGWIVTDFESFELCHTSERRQVAVAPPVQPENEIKRSCENCGKPEEDQALVESDTGLNEYWCLDCMRLAGRCLSCAKDIRLQVEDYFNYDDDICPECLSADQQPTPGKQEPLLTIREMDGYRKSLHVTRSDKFIGHVYPEVDGDYVFVAEGQGAWSDYALKAIADILFELNKDNPVNHIGKQGIESLLELLAQYGGTIESTGKMDEMNIKQARASGRMWVDNNSLGYVWMPGKFSNGPFPETVEEVQLFEKWFPLEVELPESLKTLDWLHKKKPASPGKQEGGKYKFVSRNMCNCTGDNHDDKCLYSEKYSRKQEGEGKEPTHIGPSINLSEISMEEAHKKIVDILYECNGTGSGADDIVEWLKENHQQPPSPTEIAEGKLTPEGIVDENFKGLGDLIQDKDLTLWYKQLIVTCLEEYGKQCSSLPAQQIAGDAKTELENILGTVNFSSHKQMREAIEGAMEYLASLPSTTEGYSREFVEGLLEWIGGNGYSWNWGRWWNAGPDGTPTSSSSSDLLTAYIDNYKSNK